MQKYDDKQNAQGVYIIFIVIQMILLALMYTIVYAAFRATQLAVEKYQLNELSAFAPTVIIFIAVPVLLYRTRKMFRQGRMMEAILWMMALLSVFLVGLLMHVSNISQI
jgi:Kef-type K+ transport system membrane component KefB